MNEDIYYETFYRTENKTEDYKLNVKAVKERSVMSDFRCGVAPIHLEIGRLLHTS